MFEIATPSLPPYFVDFSTPSTPIILMKDFTNNLMNDRNSNLIKSKTSNLFSGEK